MPAAIAVYSLMTGLSTLSMAVGEGLAALALSSEGKA